MKTLPLVAFLSALAAAIVLPISIELASSLVFAAGLGCILLADYSTVRSRPLTVGATARRERSALRLAA